MARKEGSMHVDTRPRTYRAVDGSVREYRQALLRRSHRNAQGKPAKETLANLSMLPAHAVEVLRKSLAGATLVEAGEAFEIDHVVARGHVAAVHAMASHLRFGEFARPTLPGTRSRVCVDRVAGRSAAVDTVDHAMVGRHEPGCRSGDRHRAYR
jgi:hypothetical protein